MNATATITNTVTSCGVTVAEAMVGDTAMAYPLTPCCGASAKGGADGIVCRACYAPLGWHWAGTLEDTLRGEGCPCPELCAENTRWTLGRMREDD